MSAVRKGDEQGLSMVRALLQLGNCPDNLEVQYATFFQTRLPAALVTPLFIAAEMGSIQILKELLKHGATPNKGRHSWNFLEVLNSETPLHAAARGGHVPALQALIEAGAPPSEGRLVLWGLLGGTSPLHAAVQAWQGDSESLEILKLLQTDDSIHGHWGLDFQETLLYAAANAGHREVVEALLRTSSFDARSWRSQGRFLGPGGIFGYTSPLYAAAAQGHLEVAELMLKREARAERGLHTLFEQASPNPEP